MYIVANRMKGDIRMANKKKNKSSAEKIKDNVKFGSGKKIIDNVKF